MWAMRIAQVTRKRLVVALHDKCPANIYSFISDLSVSILVEQTCIPIIIPI